VENEIVNTTTNTSKVTSSSVKYKGYNVIGTIQIPKTNVKYPIVDSITSDAMDKAIVMLYGSGLNQIGNTVLAGHNYRNGGFFGNNKKLEIGDKIYITDLSGLKIEYSITNKYTTTDSDFEYATRDTNGKREISLSTCTTDASQRLVIWAVESN
jgi:LPXTG-site transpeptidase (sortase) family protein